MNSFTLPQLALRAQAGDADAREALFDHAARLAYARAYRAVRDFDAAGDIAQEALVQAVIGLSGLRSAEAFLAWLRTIVDRAIMANARRHARSAETGIPPDSAPEVDGGVAEAALSRLELEQIRRGMAALPPKSRLMVELFYFEGMTCAEVAEFLHVSRDAVKTTLKRSRERMRERMTSMVTASRPATVTMSFSSGVSHSEAQPFDHDSDSARFYLALYPRGLADKAAAQAGVTSRRAEEIITHLVERLLIAEEDGVWRCTAPVVSDVDLEVLKPWAKAAAAPVLDELEGLHAEAQRIAETVEGEDARQTVLAVALYSEAVREPFEILREPMQAIDPDRGRFGRFSLGYSTADGFPQGFNGLRHCGTVSGPSGEAGYWYLHPVGTDRSGIAGFMREFGLDRRSIDESIGDSKRGIFALLLWLAGSPATEDEVAAKLPDFRLAVQDARAFIGALERLHALRRVEETLEAAVPVTPIGLWLDYAARLHALSERVGEALGDNAEDLRRRVLRCSFAHCNWADSFTACVMVARGQIGDAIRERGWVTLPKAADFSWGCLLAR